MLKSALVTAALLTLAPVLHAADAPDTSTWARFSAFTYHGTMPVTPGSGQYLNPIIAGFHPDPSICRVGDDYYLVNSAFNYFPGIPIFHSKDLVNWTQIGNVLDRPLQFPMRLGGNMQDGTYAPTIRYHNGTFYMINTLVGSQLGNYYVTAKDPKGPWSDPIKLKGIGGIDPDFFFDDDGKCYVTSCDSPEQSQYNGHRAIKLQEMDLVAQTPVGEKTTIINGGTDITKQPSWCEGPHVYRINGTYYAMCAQGGTSTAHTEVIFKSQQGVRGPYVPWDKNPVLTQMDLPNNRPDMVTCTGHADLVQTQNGDWFAVFLGCQPYDGRNFNTGRETFMLPVSWTPDKWPVILPPQTAVPLAVKKPNLPADKPAAVATTGKIDFTDNFDGDALDFRWVQIRAPQGGWYSTSKGDKALYLQPRADALSSRNNPSCLLIRQQNNDYSASVTLTAQPTTANCVAGLTAFHNETHYYALNVKIDAGKMTEISFERPAAGARGGRGGRGGAGRAGGRGAGGGPDTANAEPAPATVAPPTTKLPDNTTSIQLKVEGAGPTTKFYYKAGNADFVQIGPDLESSFLSTDSAGGFQGAMLGMFVHN